MFRVYYTSIFFIGLVINAFIKPFMKIYVGSEFFDSWRYVPILLISACFSGVAAYYAALYVASKKTINNMITAIIGAIINIGLNLILIPQIGVWGAIVSTFVSYSVIAIVRMLDIRRKISLKIDWPLFTLNSIILILQALTISFNFYTLYITLFTMAVFLLINKKTIGMTLKGFKALIVR